jgi:hypothetical protein
MIRQRNERGMAIRRRNERNGKGTQEKRETVKVGRDKRKEESAEG